MEHLKNMAFIPKFHPAEELKVRALKASCLGFCNELTPSQLDAREKFVQLYLHPTDLPAADLLRQCMEHLDRFFFFGLLTQVPEEDRLPLRLRQKPDDGVFGLGGYYSRTEYEMTLLTTVWGTKAPATLDVLLGTLARGMARAYLDVFYDAGLARREEVHASRGRGTAFAALRAAVHATVRSWSPALAGLHAGGEVTTAGLLPLLPRDDDDDDDDDDDGSLVIIGDRFRPIREYAETRKKPSPLSRWAARVASKLLGTATAGHAAARQPIVRES